MKHSLGSLFNKYGKKFNFNFTSLVQQFDDMKRPRTHWTRPGPEKKLGTKNFDIRDWHSTPIVEDCSRTSESTPGQRRSSRQMARESQLQMAHVEIS